MAQRIFQARVVERTHADGRPGKGAPEADPLHEQWVGAPQFSSIYLKNFGARESAPGPRSARIYKTSRIMNELVSTRFP